MHHFAHVNSDCSHGVETILHMMAKTILEKEKRMLLPEVAIGSASGYKAVLHEEMLMEFDEVMLEHGFGVIIPDIVLVKGKTKLFVEIFVTHRVDEDKEGLIRDANISAIEIDLSSMGRMISEDELRDILLTDSSKKKWIFNRIKDTYLRKWRSLCTKKSITSRGFASHVDYCPINARVYKGKPYANLCDDCWNCPYYFDIACDEWKYTTAILCCGDKKISTLEELKRWID